MHLMFNSISLYYLGPQVEGLFGSQKFIFIYLASGIFSNVASYSFGIHGAGASGSIFGLIGLMVVYGHRLGGSFGGAIRQQMLIWAVAGFIYGFVMGADNVAHAGGFVAGAALAYVIPAEEPTLARSALIWNITAIVCALVVVASFGMVAKNYGNAQAESSIMQSFESAARLEDEFRRSANWKTPADGDPRELASRLRTAASSLNRYADLDSRSQQICARLVDLANKRAAALDAAGAGGAPVAEANNQEIQSAFEEYLAWWHAKRRELGLE
jgi:hypothetical protein